VLPDPASQQGERIAGLWNGFVLAALAVGLLVWGLITYALIRYRRRSDDELPNQKPYNIPLEILYTSVPVVVVGVLFAFSVQVQTDVERRVADPDVRITVEGFQWQWRFTYPDDGITLVGTPDAGPPELVLPIGETVRFDLVADDVAHSFWVPEFIEKRDLIPGVVNEIDITPTREGTFVGRCAEFCGLDHWRMSFSVRIVPADEFDRWVAEHGRA
jgi:cytochrome c oxidase subunit 2